MPGMGAPAGPQQCFPALAAVLALFMLGYIVWTTDRLTSQTRPRATTAEVGSTQEYQSPDNITAQARTHDAATAPHAAAAKTRPDNPAGRPALAPKLAACSKIAMSISTGYMLVLML